MYRQGDILIVKEEKIPERVEKLDTNIIAFGELTGHHHKVDDATQLFGWNNVPQFMIVDGQTELTHQEHNTITIPEGTYRIIRQREFDGTEARAIRD